MERHYLSFSVVSLLLFILCFTIFLFNTHIAYGFNYKSADVKKSSTPYVHIDEKEIIRAHLPKTLLGFNINLIHFENDLIDSKTDKPKQSLLDYLKQYPGILYRYPGGLIANEFNWEESIGDIEKRGNQKLLKHVKPRRVVFGLDEYLNFILEVKGQPLYVLNLSGWSTTIQHQELDISTIVESNKKLAKKIMDRLKPLGIKRIYQLGNELDRSKYEWSTEKYIDRSLAVINAINEVDGDAIFMPFLRDFNWKYTNHKRGKSKWRDFVSQTVNSIESNNMSLHFYYGSTNAPKKFRISTVRANKIKTAIDYMKTQSDQKIDVWITEHAIDWYTKDKEGSRNFLQTSNIEGGLETADALMQMIMLPEITGAAWHSMNGGPWAAFSNTDELTVTPRPVTEVLMSVLYPVWLPQIMKTDTFSPNFSKHYAGYDIRALAMKSSDNSELGLWIINKSKNKYEIPVQYLPYKNKSKNSSKNSVFLNNVDDYLLEDGQTTSELNIKNRANFNREGYTTISVKPYSITSIYYY
ncbi:MAG: hypothetical protein P8163_18895 [Candidatus Thiodiazotropha sp.]